MATLPERVEVLEQAVNWLQRQEEEQPVEKPVEDGERIDALASVLQRLSKLEDDVAVMKRDIGGAIGVNLHG